MGTKLQLRPQSPHVAPVSARNWLVEEMALLDRRAARGPISGQIRKALPGTVDVNELPAEGTHFFGVCVPHLRTGTHRFLRTLRGTQKGAQKNPVSVDS